MGIRKEAKITKQNKARKYSMPFNIITEWSQFSNQNT
jgi:hypothetical protein